MRYLHRVQMHEKFVASGTYQTATNIVEMWSIHEQPGGSRLVRLDEETPDRIILLEAWINLSDEGRVIERLDLFGRSKVEDTAIKTVKATYNFFDDHIQVGRTVNDTERYHGEVAIKPQYVGTYLLSSLLFGYTIARVAQVGLPCIVASPEINFIHDEGFSFAENLGWMEVKSLGEEDLAIKSKVYRVRKFDVYLDKKPYTAAYLDPNDILLKLDHLEFDLLNYARRPT
jgi:hypothetical protein